MSELRRRYPVFFRAGDAGLSLRLALSCEVSSKDRGRSPCREDFVLSMLQEPGHRPGRRFREGVGGHRLHVVTAGRVVGRGAEGGLRHSCRTDELSGPSGRSHEESRRRFPGSFRGSVEERRVVVARASEETENTIGLSSRVIRIGGKGSSRSCNSSGATSSAQGRTWRS